jgi:hypothetical protein
VPKTAEEYDVSIHELPTFLFLEAETLVLFNQNPNFLTFKENMNPCSLAGRYEHPIPTQFITPIDGSKIPAQNRWYYSHRTSFQAF